MSGFAQLSVVSISWHVSIAGGVKVCVRKIRYRDTEMCMRINVLSHSRNVHSSIRLDTIDYTHKEACTPVINEHATYNTRTRINTHQCHRRHSLMSPMLNTGMQSMGVMTSVDPVGNATVLFWRWCSSAISAFEMRQRL